MFRRLTEFLLKNDFFSAHQYGFRKGSNTRIAVVELLDKIMNAVDNNEYVLGIFLDLAKAFDTVDHKILLEKLEKAGIRGVALKLLKAI